MPIELNKRATKELDFTLDGKPLATRKLTIGAQLGLQSLISDVEKMQVPPEKVAEVVVDALVYPDTGQRVFGSDDIPKILDMDGDLVSAIFRQITEFAFSGKEEAKKN